MSYRILVTGIGIGKTTFFRWLRQSPQRAPLETGSNWPRRRDRRSARHTSGGLCTDRVVPELIGLRAAASPHHSAEIDGVRMLRSHSKVRIPESGRL